MTNIREAFTIREKILSGNNNGSMVAKRLLWLLGKTDLTGIKQILDIGSWHLGQSIEFSNIFDHACIDAFEPVPGSYQLCLNRLHQLDEQKKNRIKVHNIALSNKVGEIPFYPVNTEITQKFDAGFSSMFPLNEELTGSTNIQQEIKVRASTLDGWSGENNISAVDILWMDVQGAELLVLEGAKSILNHTRIIMTEVGLKPYYEGHTLKTDIDALLLGLGFQELKNSFEINIRDYEANTIYIKH